jgi:hypothetical protein
MKQALILGCSHAAGSEITSTWDCCNDSDKLKSFAAQIASRQGYNVNNLAIPGGSNDAMFRIFEECTLSVDLVIAVWSGITRTEIFYNNKWPQICVGGPNKIAELDEYIRQWALFQANEQWGRVNKIKNVIALNALAQARNIPVINIDAFWDVEPYVWPEYVYWPTAVTFYQWALHNKYPATEWGHFDINAHTDFATYVLENLVLTKTSLQHHQDVV